jgi:hypothetical protein
VRTALRIAIVAAALAALLATFTVTPVGWRVAAAGLRAAVRGTGLELTIGSLSGNLLRHVTIEDVALREPGGSTIARIDRIEARYALGGLILRRIVVPELRVTGAELLFVVGPDGKLVGWSRFAPEPAASGPDAARGRAWTVDVSLDARDLKAAYRDSAAGLAVEAAGVAIEGRGGLPGYRAAADGAIALSAPRLERELAGRFTLAVSGADGRVTLEPSRLVTTVGEAGASGDMGGDGIHLAVDARLDLARLSDALGVAGLAGSAEIGGSADGPAESMAYEAHVSGRDLVLGAARVPRAEADLSGTRREVTLERLRAEFAGGTVEGSGRVDLTARAAADSAARGGTVGSGRTAAFEFRVAARGIDLSRVAAVLSAGAPELAGSLDASVAGRGTLPGAEQASAQFDVRARDLAVAGTQLGAATVSGALDAGRLTAEGECLAVQVAALGTVDAGGLRSLEADLETTDISVAGAALRVPDLAGSGSARAVVTVGSAGPRLTVDAVIPDLRLSSLQAGPVTASAAGEPSLLAVNIAAFGSALTAVGTVGEGGEYAFTVAADGLPLSWSSPDTLLPSAAIEVTADAQVHGKPGGAFAADGIVDRIEAQVGGEHLTVAHPARFAASPESLRVSSLVLTGELGEIAVGGVFSAGGENNVIARLGRLDLERTAALFPRVTLPLSGSADGTVTVLGSGLDRRVSADVGIESLRVGGVALDAVALTAESDSSDLFFDLTALSRDGGSMTASGAVPVRPDSLRVLVLDADREFGATVTWSHFAVTAGGAFLPGVRGEKRFELDGSVLLAGTVDSLETMYGRGRLEAVAAEFERVSFSLSTPLDIEIAGGDVELPGAQVAMVRRRALGERTGGSVTIGGELGHDGALALDLTVDRLDVGQLLEAFVPAAGGAFAGRLDGHAEIRHSWAAPEGAFGWAVTSPVIYGVGFTRLTGQGRFESGAVVLESVELTAPGGVVTASGTVPLASPGAARDLDIAVRVDSFDLGDLAALPPGVGPVDGSLSADIRAAGTAARPMVSGSLGVRDGSIGLAGLAEPIRDVTIDVVIDEGVAALREARASLGHGSVSASGYARILGAGERPFLLKAVLDSPEFEVPGTLAGRFGGDVTWAGSAAGSRLAGDVRVEKLDVTREFGLGDILTAGPVLTVRPRASDPRARVALDLDVDLPDGISVRSNLADVRLAGGVHLGGTLLTPQVSGGVYAERGTFRYLDNTFELRTLNVAFTDNRRRDPYVQLEGTADVMARSDEAYAVTMRLDGFAFDAVPELSSDPPLSGPDIVSLLTFGDTVGALVGDGRTGTSGESWSGLARGAFLGGVVGVAEGTLEDLLRLDTVKLESEAVRDGTLDGADLTIGKRLGDRLRVEYTTALGRFDEREIEVALRIIDVLSLESRADPEGNHAIGLRLRIPFR